MFEDKTIEEICKRNGHYVDIEVRRCITCNYDVNKNGLGKLDTTARTGSYRDTVYWKLENTKKCEAKEKFLSCTCEDCKNGQTYITALSKQKFEAEKKAEKWDKVDKIMNDFYESQDHQRVEYTNYNHDNLRIMYFNELVQLHKSANSS